MDRLDVRIGRCSLALSLAATAGLAASLVLAVAGGPNGSAALTLQGSQSLLFERGRVTAQARSERRRRSARRRRTGPVEQERAQNTDRSLEDDPAGTQAPPLPKPHPSRTKAAAGREAEAASADHPAPEPEVEPVWSQAEIVEALEECVRLLAPIAASLDVSKPIRSGQCGSPAPVVLKRVGTTSPVEISPPAVINCRMVARLHAWIETTLQPAARDMLDAPVTRMANASGYVCRNRYGAANGRISEHAFANALDISAFRLADGRSVDVLTDWGQTERDRRAIAQAKAKAEQEARAAAAKVKAAAKKKNADKGKDAQDGKVGGGKAKAASQEEAEGEPPARAERAQLGRQAAKEKRRRGRQTAAADAANAGGNVRPVAKAEAGEDARITTNGAFLRRLHDGACDIFGTVLGPEANEAHRNHFHFDLALRKRRAFCE